ncbi:unnamed protein product [Phytophthora fragariaefolia]|uniref:Unnamed protein product n=1 Tax=Phytophthora fragariaefolia TaxID=1490495 RepID=A0A9W6XR16_9STRA|nr:unnamed protein product [Phytophthora fragariaefolia]
MVRVPGSSGDSQRLHRESTEEDVKIKTKPGNELSTEEGSTACPAEEATVLRLHDFMFVYDVNEISDMDLTK